MATTNATDAYPSPITHRESDTEETHHRQRVQGAEPPTQMSGRKRTASEMEDDGSDNTDVSGDSEASGESEVSGASRGGPASQEGTVATESTESSTSHIAQVLDTVEPEFPEFTVTCPVWSKRMEDFAKKGDVLVLHDYPPPHRHLSVHFGVSPGSIWKGMNRFKNAKFKDPYEVTYSAGQFVFVNRRTPVPPVLEDDASDDERLQYDKENYWVAMISEFKALSQQTVYVRLFWLYWPDELPMGRQPYHGKRELVMSNQVDIIDAQSIAWHADVSHWDEKDDSNKTVLEDMYWRQTLDIRKHPTHPNALSRLRRFCICGGYDNPERDMYQCHNADCRMWNHEACLIDAIETRAWGRFRKGTLAHEVEVMETDGNVTQNNIETGDHVVNSTSKSDTPWAGKLEGKIIRARELGEDEYTHRAIIRQLVPQGKNNGTDAFEPVIWNMKMNCLRCYKPLD